MSRRSWPASAAAPVIASSVQLDVGPDRLFGLASTTRRDVGPGAAREIERMDALGVVELQRLSEGVKDTA